MCSNTNMQRILEELGGIAESTYKEFVHDFVAQSLQDIRKARKAPYSADMIGIAKMLHSIKGAAGNLRLEKVRSMAIAIEAVIKKNADADTVDRELQAFEQVLCATDT